MGDIKISIIMIVFNIDNLLASIESVYKQSVEEWELFLLTKDSQPNLLPKFTDNRIKNINIPKNSDLFNSIKLIIPKAKGKYLCILNSEDINDMKRLELQMNYLELNSAISIVSCLHMPIYKEEIYLKNSAISNRFINENDIDNTISGGFLSLDLYTFLIRKNLLNKIYKFLYLYSLKDELDWILYLLRYSKIPKLNKVLYYFRKQRIPYKESLYYDDKIESSNRLVRFNINNSLTLREYFNQILPIKPVEYNIPYKHSILILLDTIKIGGTETHVLSLAKSLKQQGIASCILTNQCICIEEFILNSIEVKIINLNNRELLKETITNLSKTHNFKEINLHMVSDIYLCPFLKEFTNLNVTLTIHGTYYPEEIILKYSKYLSKIIFVSKTTEKFYLDYVEDKNKTKCLLIPNCINPCHLKNNKKYIHKLLNLPYKSKVILYCSRLSYSKAYAGLQFLESFQKLAVNNSNIYAVIIGDGDSKVLIDSKVEKINSILKNQRVFALGSKFNLNDFYLDSYIVIGTGRVALEALNNGKPVIAVGLKGYSNIVNKTNIKSLLDTNFGDHAEGRYLNQDNIYSQNLTDNLEYLLNNPIETRLLGNWSQHFCHKYLNFNYLFQYIM